jgi:hypothetical protein
MPKERTKNVKLSIIPKNPEKPAPYEKQVATLAKPLKLRKAPIIKIK